MQGKDKAKQGSGMALHRGAEALISKARPGMATAIHSAVQQGSGVAEDGKARDKLTGASLSGGNVLLCSAEREQREALDASRMIGFETLGRGIAKHGSAKAKP